METLLKHWRDFGESIAIIEDEEKFSFNTFIVDIEKTSHEITSQINTNNTAFVWNYSPCYSNVVLLFAIARCGGIIVPENSAHRIFSSKVENRIHLGESSLSTFQIEDFELTLELKKRQSSGIIISTSGTSQQPKDVLLDFSLLCLKYLKLQSKFVSVLTFSLEHISGIETLISILSPGGTIVLPTGRNPHQIADAIKQNKASLLSCTPSFLIQLHLKNLLNQEYFETIKIINCGGEPLREIWQKKFQEKIPNVNIRQAFGTTESTNLRTSTHPTNSRLFKPGLHNEDFIIKQNRLLLRSLGYLIGDWNKGFKNNDAWIETGDMVVEAEDGFLEVINRWDTLILVGGNKVNAQEVEEIILQLPIVQFARVYGESNLILGQIVVADVVCDANADLLALKSIIRQHCYTHLDDFKVPVKIKKLNELPLTTRMKYDAAQ